MSFADINDNMDCAEAYLKYCVEWALTNCQSDIEWFSKNTEEGLVQRLENVVRERFVRLTYTDAIEELKVCLDEGGFADAVVDGLLFLC